MFTCTSIGTGLRTQYRYYLTNYNHHRYIGTVEPCQFRLFGSQENHLEIFSFTKKLSWKWHMDMAQWLTRRDPQNIHFHVHVSVVVLSLSIWEVLGSSPACDTGRLKPTTFKIGSDCSFAKSKSARHLEVRIKVSCRSRCHQARKRPLTAKSGKVLSIGLNLQPCHLLWWQLPDSWKFARVAQNKQINSLLNALCLHLSVCHTTNLSLSLTC
jgi:hypothetical protein